MYEEVRDGAIGVYPDFNTGEVVFEVGPQDGAEAPDFTCSLAPEIAYELARELSMAAMKIEDHNAGK